MTTLHRLIHVLRHLWQCSNCGAWSTEPTVNGLCGACR